MAHLGLTIAYTELNAPAAARRGARPREGAGGGERSRSAARRRARAADGGGGGAGGTLRSWPPTGPRSTRRWRRIPQDEELWLLRGLAESPDPAERGQGSVAGSIRVLREGAGACAGAFCRASLSDPRLREQRPDRARRWPQGATYAKMAPGVPHARHMHGHNLRRAGRIDEAIAEFAPPTRCETAYFAAETMPVEYDWHYQHNLDLLATSYQYVGQMAKAEALFKAAFAIPSSLVVQEFNKREWPVFLLARGRAEGGARRGAACSPAHRSPVVSAIGHVEAGRAQLALGAVQGGRRRGERGAAADARRARGRGPGGDAAEGAAGGVLPAHRAEGRRGGRCSKRWRARSARRPGPTRGRRRSSRSRRSRARRARSATGTSPPGPRRQMLEHDPNYAGSHYALALVAEHNGDAQTAARRTGAGGEILERGRRGI